MPPVTNALSYWGDYLLLSERHADGVEMHNPYYEDHPDILDYLSRYYLTAYEGAYAILN